MEESVPYYTGSPTGLPDYDAYLMVWFFCKELLAQK